MAYTTSDDNLGITAVGAIAALIFLVQALYLWNFAIDDVGISYRYAEHLADGLGLTWNPGDAPVEGYSNFLWVLILATSRFVGLDITVASKALGIALGVASVSGITALCARLWHRQRFWWMPVILVALTPEWTAWATSGLEIALYGALLTLGLLALKPDGRTNSGLLAVAICGLALTRPEGSVIGLLLIIASALSGRRIYPGMRETLAAIAVPSTSLVILSLGMIGLRIWYFGDALPNTVHAKFDTDLPSAVHVLKWAIFCIPYLAGLLWAGGRLAPGYQRGFLLVCAGLVAAQMLIVLPVSPVMYFLHRYQIAFLPSVVFATPLILAKAAERNRGIATVVAVLLLFWSAQGWPGVLRRNNLESYVIERQKCVEERLQNLPGRPTIALVDAGRIPYWTELRAIDAWGLCDEEIARKGFSPDLVLSRRPDVYILSLDVRRERASGNLDLRPHLGMDIMMAKTPSFQTGYGLWKICSPGITPETDDSTSLYYDYGVFLNSDWAREHGLFNHISFVTWPY